MMNYIYKITLLILLLATASCNDAQDEYYNSDTEETVNMTVLELIDQTEQFSTFSRLFREYHLDTLFSLDKTNTLFIPSDDVFEQRTPIFLDTLAVLRYYATASYINVAHIPGNAVVQTVGKKYVTITNTGASVMYDNAEVNYESPLCSDGKFYGISAFVQPRPNIYEYIAATNDFYKDFIDAQDTMYLDPNSTPIGYDEDENTIYDTIWIEENTFEKEYFPISQELRDSKATLLLFTGEQMESALEDVKSDLGLSSIDDIPSVWINDIMMPAITQGSVFARELQPADYASGMVKNIQGDSVAVNADDISSTPFQCSNGLAYGYTNFVIPQELYFGTDTIHSTDLVVEKTATEYTWGPDVKVKGLPYIPTPEVTFYQKIGRHAVSVPLKETNEFEMTATFSNMFPNQYLLICNVKTDPSGVFKIYANDQLLDVTIKKGFAYGGTTTKDYIDIHDLRNQGSTSSPNTIKYVSDKRYSFDEGFRTFEVLIENVDTYGDVEIKIEYDGPSPDNMSNQGLILNYMTLESWSE